MAKKQPEKPVDITLWREDRKALQALMQRAESGDTSVLPMVRQALAANPDLLKSYGDIVNGAKAVMIAALSLDNPCRKEALRIDLERLRQEVEGANPSPLERLLAERVCLCQMQLSVVEGYYWINEQAGATDHKREAMQKAIDRAQDQLLKACKALAQVRRLQVPSLQVNIADKQINLGG